jgi:Fic family protein
VKPIKTPPYTITSKILKLSTKISEELTKLEFHENSRVAPLLRKKNRIKTLAGTLEIEGNYLGEEKITAILEGKHVLGTVKELAEVEGVISAYEAIENYNYTSLDDLLQAHKLMMNGLLITAGEFRSVNVAVGEHIAPPAAMVLELMENLFYWLKQTDEHPLISSSVFHYEFEFIHPFSDGNGRIGRLWQNVILQGYKKVYGNIAIESIVRDHQEEYYKALEHSTEAGESTPFIEFMLEMILEAIESSVKDSDKSSVNTDEKLLQLFQENPHITIKALAERLRLTTRAIEKQIATLKKESRLIRVGSARKGHWEVKNT